MIDLELIKARRASIDLADWKFVQHNAHFLFLVVDADSGYVEAFVPNPYITVFIRHAPDDMKALIEEVERLQSKKRNK